MNPFRPHQYHLRLRPDLERFSFRGWVTIDGTLAGPAEVVHLHGRELVVERCTLTDTRGTVDCTPRSDGDDRLALALARPASGAVRIDLEYRGPITDGMAGFYRSRYRSEGRDGWLALTQFQESDARRALPCVDEPDAKAVFAVELEIPEQLDALSNTPRVGDEPMAGGWRRVRFAPTPEMSSYLLFFAVGPFSVGADPVDPRVRVATLPGVPAAHTELGLDFGRNALGFCEEYFQIPYPLKKMDLIAVPDFAFGAMENWGAITFRENLLLQVPGVTSRLGEERICEVIAHEVAHQWFGNLVTPRGWEYLWLNESFATYFAYKVLDRHRPGWQAWQSFLLGQTEVALERDALRSSFAIEMPDDAERRVAITESTAPIIYSKGGSILRQVEGYVGAAGFRAGLHRYLTRHAYGNAASHHLWDAVGEAAEKPVAALMRDWVEQPGHPLLTARRDGRRLLLEQRRFTLLPDAGTAVWRVPVQVAAFLADGAVQEREVLLDAPRGELELPRDTVAYKVNAGQTGFYRVRYADPADRDALGPRVRAGELGPADRWGLHSDLYALVLAGQAPLDSYLEFLAWFDREQELLPMASIARALRHLHRVLPAAPAARVAATGAHLLDTALQRVGPTPRAGEPHGHTVLRDQLLWDAAVLGSPSARAAGTAAFERLQRGEPVAADLVRSALQIGAWSAADPGACREWLQTRFQGADSEHQRIDVLTALGSLHDVEALGTALEFALQRVPDRIRFVALVSAAANPAAAGWLWPWFESHLDQLEGFHPMLFERVWAAVVPVAGLVEPERTRRFAEAYTARRPEVGEVTELALEKLAIHAALRAHGGGGPAAG